MSKDDQLPQKSPVGYGRPPAATRFRKGVSGNPRGRPKGARNLTLALRSVLAERLVVNENGKRKHMTKLDATLKQLVNRAAKGDVHFIRVVIAILQAIEQREQTNGQAIVFIERDEKDRHL